MERLWAPWRMEYITETRGAGCVFCLDSDLGRDRERLVLYRSRHAFIMMNRYPYTNGHLLVCPHRHTAEIQSLSPDEMLELFSAVKLGSKILQESIGPDGLNIGMNLGKAAGAGVNDHLHIHIVPRWNGDTNFMTVVADVRIVPESLDATYERLAPAFRSLP